MISLSNTLEYDKTKAPKYEGMPDRCCNSFISLLPTNT